MSFRNAFVGTDIELCIQPGNSALGSHNNLIITPRNQSIEASVNIDQCLRDKFPHQNRWDYAFGYKTRIFYIEVHSAKDDDVKVVIEKFKWLKSWQNDQHEPISLKKNSSYYWIASGRVKITKNSQFSRQLIKVGLGFPIRQLRLD